MMTSTRNKLLAVLAELSDTCPQVRLGQLISQLSYMAREISPEAIGNVEDSELLAAAQKQLDELKQVEESNI